MDFSNPLTWKGVLFTGLNIIIMLSLAWWLFLSPRKNPVEGVLNPSPRLVGGVVISLGIAVLCMIIGAMWDASVHIQTRTVPGISDFLWPSHLLIYSGFLLSFLVAGLVFLIIAINGWRNGSHDPRDWARMNPYLSAIVLTSAFTMLSIPGDAIWHELVGADLTAWSPPHILIALSSSLILVSAIGIYLQQKFNRKTYKIRNFVVILLSGLMLNILYLIGVLEWDLPGPRSIHVMDRPIWLYPFIGGILSFYVIVLAKRLTKYRFAGTGVAIVFYAVRLGVTLGLSLTGNVTPYIPLPFIVGAFMVDLVSWEHIRSHLLRMFGMASAYTLGYAFLAFPILADRTDLPFFGLTDVIMTLLMTFVGAALFVPIIHYTGRRLSGRQPVH